MRFFIVTIKIESARLKFLSKDFGKQNIHHL